MFDLLLCFLSSKRAKKIFVASQNLRIHVFAKNEAKKSSQSSRRLREVSQSNHDAFDAYSVLEIGTFKP